MQRGYIINLCILGIHGLEWTKESGHLNLSLDVGMKGSDEYPNQPIKTGIISQEWNFSSSLNNLFQYLKVSNTQE